MPDRLVLLGGSGLLGGELYATLRAARDRASPTIVVVDPVRPAFDLTGGDGWVSPDDPALGSALAGTNACVNLAAKVFANEQGLERQIVELVDATMAPIHMTFPVLEPSLRVWIQVSSISVYAPEPDGRPLKECSRTTPPSPYGLAKLAAEIYLETHLRSRDVVLQRLRLGDLYGGPPALPHDTRLLPTLLRAITAGDPVRRFGNGTARRELLHVRDAARAIVLALESPRSGPWNVAAPEKVTFNALLEAVDACHPVGIDVETVAAALTRDHVLDGEAFAEAYGFQPVVSLRQGIAEAVDQPG